MWFPFRSGSRTSISKKTKRPQQARRPGYHLMLENLEDRLAPATFNVLNTADSGADSLRQAILDANANPGSDLIEFNIPGTGTHTITPGATNGGLTGLGGLPVIDDAVIIDGRTQPGYAENAGKPLIEINGASAGPAHGLFITAGDSTVAGLNINNFSDAGILLWTNGNNTIADNFIGTDVAGTAAQGNDLFGVLIENGSHGNQVLGNTISANGNSGVWILTNNNVAAGNKIGTNSSGTAALGNGLHGVFLGGGAQANLIGTDGDGLNDAAEANVISGNFATGVGMSEVTSNVVAGNFIGTDVTGTLLVGNGGGIHFAGGDFNEALDNVIAFNQRGIVIFNGSDSSHVAGNTILGNVQAGVWIETHANVVSGNFIGTDAGGTLALSNDLGIYFGGGTGNEVSDNVIAFNTYGVVVDGVASSSNVFQDNEIRDQLAAGVYLAGGVANDTIIVALGAAPGVTVFELNGVTVAEVGNSGALTIDGWENDDTYTLNLDGLAVDVYVDDSGTLGSDNLTVNATADPDYIDKTGDTVKHWLRSNSPEGNPTPPPPLVTVNAIGIDTATTITGEAGNDLILDPGTDTIILGGLGDDTIIINATFGNGVVVDGQDGSDNYIVMFGNLAGPVTVADSGSTGTDTLTAQGTPGNDTTTLTGNQMQNGTETIIITAPVANLVVEGGEGDDSTTIDGFTAPIANLTVDGGAGANPVTIVGSPPPGVTLDLVDAVQTVAIDVRRESLNLASNGVIAVVVSTTAGFNASTVDVGSVVFAGAHAVRSTLEDADGDGDLDMVLHFRTQDTYLRGLYEVLVADDMDGDGVLDSNHQLAEVGLAGQTGDGVSFEGFDQLDLFLSGKALRQLLAELAAGGAI